ncbi:MAG: phosphate acyltransferase PlsX [Lachnospiraceae bacterium]|nr:phosphate acyltransferase PlsX [Lachnospiraceae bacterium]
MSDLVRVAVDAMGGDNAPEETVRGAVKAVNDSPRVNVFLVGQEERITPILQELSYDKQRLTVVHAPEVISTAEPPVMAIRNKRDSSLVKGMMMVREGQADAYVSAGSTGAVLVGGQTVIGRIKGVSRSPLAPLIPTEKGSSLLIDCGANVDARAQQLVQFAKIGSIYMENICKIKYPRVALVNIGAEEEKGNLLVRETFPLLKNCPDINFTGNIEARDIPAGEADVIVCEAFVGNVILKMYEGVSQSLMRIIKQGMMSSTRGKIGGALVKPSLKSVLKEYDPNRHGGAPMLGLNGLVVKAHGSSNRETFCNAILQCVEFHEERVGDQIAAKIGED